MSGRKCSNVTISQNAYDSLNNRARRADAAAANAERRARREKQKYGALHRQVVTEQKRMQQEFRASVETLSSEIRDVEIRQAERLEDLRYDVARGFDEQRAEFRSALKQQREETQRAFSELRTEIAAEKDAARAQAEAQLTDVETLFAALAKDKAHQKFAHGKLDELTEKLNAARGNLQSGRYEAALAAVQERYFEFQDLRQLIAERQSEWTAYLQELHAQASEMLGLADASQSATYRIGGAGDEKDVDVEANVEFWSRGKFGNVVSRIEEIAQRIEDPEALSTDDLKSMIAEMSECDGTLEEVVEDARASLIQSQLRQNLAQSVLGTFEGTQWELADSTYQQQDFREAVHFKLENPLGEEIVVSVRPVKDATGLGAGVEVNFYDKSNDERLRQARLGAIHQGLSAESIQTGQFQCLDGSENKPGADGMRDFESLGAPLAAPTESQR
jgi:hypothetical protein